MCWYRILERILKMCLDDELYKCVKKHIIEWSAAEYDKTVYSLSSPYLVTDLSKKKG